jgi:hypothetical protein
MGSVTSTDQIAPKELIWRVIQTDTAMMRTRMHDMLFFFNAEENTCI